MHPEWAPLGAARFTKLAQEGALDGTVIYRVVKGEAVQFGFIRDESKRRYWAQRRHPTSHTPLSHSASCTADQI